MSLVTYEPDLGDRPIYRTPYGMMLPAQGRIAAYVRATAQNDEDATIASKRVTTVAAALNKCRSGYNDVIVVLPGHTENITSATYLSALVAGTTIVGLGYGSNRAKLRLTDTAAQLAVAVADVVIRGMRLELEGANGVVKAINVTGANFAMLNCDVVLASGASNKATIGIELGDAAADARIYGNRFIGTATHNVTDGILVAHANASRVEIRGNTMVASATAANGLIRVSGAALGLVITDNVIQNTHTSSTACIAFGNVACSGVCARNMLATENNGVASAQGVTFGAAALIRAFENYSSDEPVKSGVLAPAAVAT